MKEEIEAIEIHLYKESLAVAMARYQQCFVEHQNFV